jgi:hypothetical protein
MNQKFISNLYYIYFDVPRSDSKLLNDLIKKGNNEKWFVLQLSRIVTIIDNAYYDSIRKNS